MDLLPGLVALYAANQGTTGNNLALCLSGVAYQHQYKAGSTIKLVSGVRNFVSSTTPETTLPANPQNGDVHYFAKDVNGSEGIYVYDGNSWFTPNMYYKSPFENGSESVADWLTLVGTTEDFLTKVGSVPDVNFLAANQNTSRKYYLKINGKEV